MEEDRPKKRQRAQRGGHGANYGPGSHAPDGGHEYVQKRTNDPPFANQDKFKRDQRDDSGSPKDRQS